MIRLENVLKTSLQDVLKTFSKHLIDVLKMSSKRLEDVLKMYDQDEYIGLDQDVLKTSSEDLWVRPICSSWSRRLQDVLKTSSEDGDERRLQDVLKMSSSRQMFAGQFLLVQMNHLVSLYAEHRLQMGYSKQLTAPLTTSC